jgi:hypothetical protein
LAFTAKKSFQRSVAKGWLQLTQGVGLKMPVITTIMHCKGGHVHYYLQCLGHLNSSTQVLKHHAESEGALLIYSELIIMMC